MRPLDKMSGDTRRMTGCGVIHYSAAVVTQYTAALMFYLKWHVIAVSNLFRKWAFQDGLGLKEEQLHSHAQ